MDAGQFWRATSSECRNRQFESAGSQAIRAEGWLCWAGIFFYNIGGEGKCMDIGSKTRWHRRTTGMPFTAVGRKFVGPKLNESSTWPALWRTTKIPFLKSGSSKRRTRGNISEADHLTNRDVNKLRGWMPSSPWSSTPMMGPGTPRAPYWKTMTREMTNSQLPLNLFETCCLRWMCRNLWGPRGFYMFD